MRTPLPALTPADVLVVANRRVPVSMSIAEYYARRRGVPRAQVVAFPMPESEEISREEFDRLVAAPIEDWLIRNRAAERILVIVTTLGVPLKIRGSEGMQGDRAAVDSELAAMYAFLHGARHPLAGPWSNPYFQREVPFRHPDFPLYLVARLAAYTFADVRAMIDRASEARNRGIAVIDLRGGWPDEGEDWLRSAAARLPGQRVWLEESRIAASGARDVIAWASFGSNDPARRRRHPGFRFLPGALVTEFVSTDARTMREPPPGWDYGDWKRPETHFAGSPQALAADWIRYGATAATGHVYEPYLQFSPRPQILLPQYLAGRTLAESFYASIPAISWMNVLLGDPLCRLAPQ
ncbi:MAG: hypothetical protein KatS3mg004_2489 [Bryobacteraceae bacterium]|nr:MAG: hypothetical protein KatS3mg004_2489 [Bryobacteraceae bacterium]